MNIWIQNLVSRWLYSIGNLKSCHMNILCKVVDSKGGLEYSKTSKTMHVILSSIFLSVSPGYLYVGRCDGLRLFELKCSTNYHKQIEGWEGQGWWSRRGIFFSFRIENISSRSSAEWGLGCPVWSLPNRKSASLSSAVWHKKYIPQPDLPTSHCPLSQYCSDSREFGKIFQNISKYFRIISSRQNNILA